MAATNVQRRLIGIIWEARTDIPFEAFLKQAVADGWSSEQIARHVADEVPEADVSARTIRRWIADGQ